MLGNDYKLRESQDMTRNSQAFWILITGFHRIILTGLLYCGILMFILILLHMLLPIH